ncbi:5-oxoprolinase subunit PxpB [Oceanobacillus sp. CAU 1775]
MGDRAIVAQFEKVMSIEVSQKIQSFLQVIKNKQIQGITELLPAFNNLTISYDPTIIQYNDLLIELKIIEQETSVEIAVEQPTIYIPITFEKKYGQDLDYIAKTTNLTTEEVIDTLHKKKYFVYMIGFIAGFPYAGNIDERLRLKRRKDPRAKVKKGTVMIVDKQIGIITMESPTGWHQVGWTPMEMFNPYREHPSLLQAGNYVKYVPISIEEAESWTEERQKEWDKEWNYQSLSLDY